MKIIGTKERTFNKKVKAQVKSLIPEASLFYKKNIGNIGEAVFILNKERRILGSVTKNTANRMTILVK